MKYRVARNTISLAFIYTLLALLVIFFGISFNKEYFSFITSKRLTLLMRVMLWTAQVGWIGAVAVLLFFQKFLVAHGKRIIFILGAIVAAVLVSEVVYRFLGAPIPKYSPHHYLNVQGTPGYKSADGLNIHNSLGFRGSEITNPKPAGVFRIAILGGSSAYEEAVRDWHNDWARQLERELRIRYPTKTIEVINAALSGRTSWGDLLTLEFKVLDIAPDMVILYPGTNDVHARSVDPPYYKGDNSGMRRDWQSRPCIVVFCLKVMQRITGIDPENFDVVADSWISPNEQPWVKSQLGLTPMEILDKNPPIYFERNLRNMIAIAREQGVGVLLATWAYSNRFGDYAATPWYERGFAENNDVIRAIGKSHGVATYDFAPVMPMEEAYWADGRHNNEAGVALKSKLFAGFVFANHLIP